MKKIIRITTISNSLCYLLKGQLKFMGQFYEMIGVSGQGESLELVRKNEDTRVHAVEMTRSITPFQDLIATYRLYKLFKKEQPFIVHTHTPKAGTLGMLAAKMAGVPHRVHTIAGLPLLEAQGVKRQLLDNVEKLTYACCTHVLPNSFELKRTIEKLKFTSNGKLKVIANGSSNGIDELHYDANKVSKEQKELLRNKLNIKNEDVVFIYLGRVVKDKGINELVSAFDQLSKEFQNSKLLIVGPREDDLDPISQESEIIITNNSQIIVPGAQSDIRPFVAISDVLAFPSYREGFPNVVLQASCMGLPCIVTDINGCNEIISDGENGIIIPPKDVKALLKAMKFMMENPKNRIKMSEGARQNIVDKYKQSLVWDELLKFYKSLE
ncbi:glycosyltransferase family 4 protein [Mangrovimonas sp. YM274]|uniref:glycosyltransferase family 4 protein n=1 Tax=Mangrovimonas sp. YM274 TaxID=3070660 RepID=UPI0027DC02E5|nr:glycosyltransferase family 4 protein [Mangrovimonas sp. YM274]WMI67267.1 glycosyltransferase family 4 protein [Mangrovimonas sp. YM274]